MADEKGTPSENRREQPPRRREMTDEERRERMERFIWQPGDITIIKHPRNLIDPPPVPVRRRTVPRGDEAEGKGEA